MRSKLARTSEATGPLFVSLLSNHHLQVYGGQDFRRKQNVHLNLISNKLQKCLAMSLAVFLPKYNLSRG